MKCLFDCGIPHGYSEPCASPESPFYDSKLVVPAKPVASPKKKSAEVIVEVVAKKSGPMSQAERNARWREKNREKYNAGQAARMRRKRNAE